MDIFDFMLDGEYTDDNGVEWIDVANAAEMAEVSVRRIRYVITSGMVNAVMRDGKYWITLRSFKRWMNSGARIVHRPFKTTPYSHELGCKGGRVRWDKKTGKAYVA